MDISPINSHVLSDTTSHERILTTPYPSLKRRGAYNDCFSYSPLLSKEGIKGWLFFYCYFNISIGYVN